MFKFDPSFIPLPPEDLERVRAMRAKEDEYIRKYCVFMEHHLLRRLEEYLNRVPSNEEMREHGQMLITREGLRTFTWRGDPILEIGPITDQYFKDLVPA